MEKRIVSIDWQSKSGAGLRVAAYLDGGAAYIGAAKIDADGETGSLIFEKARAWRTTAIYDGKLLKFWAIADREGLQVFKKNIPAHNWQGTAAFVAWDSSTPAMSF